MLNSVIVAILSISGLSTALVIIIVITDALFANYGECDILINNDKKVTVEGGNTLLNSLVENSIFIPSACGGRGSCAMCKIEVDSGAGPLLPTEEPLLTSDEISNNIRLSCQVKIRNNIEINLPEEIFSIKRYKAVCEKIETLTHDIKLVRIKLMKPDILDFKAGQYVQLETPVYRKKMEPVYRAYSIASSPEEKDAIELIIRLVPEGICTTWVHTILNEGDEVYLSGPYGEFVLQETERDIVFVAGGSGLAPIRSILYDMIEKKIKRDSVFYFGAVAKKDLYMVDLMRQLEDRLDNFSYVPALSGPDENDEWKGETGLITEVLKKNETDLSEKEAYLCGSPGMIDACIAVFKECGLPEDRIFYDKF